MDSGAPVPTSDPFQAHLDLGALGGPSHCVGALAQVGRVGTGGPIVVRSRRPGDRFQPMGMAEAKKLHHLFFLPPPPPAPPAGGGSAAGTPARLPRPRPPPPGGGGGPPPPAPPPGGAWAGHRR